MNKIIDLITNIRFGEPKEWERYRDFLDEYPQTYKWLRDNRPHAISTRVFEDKKSRWRVQIVDESRHRIGNRMKLGVTPGSGYAEREEAEIVADILERLDPSNTEGRIFTDRKGRYRWRIVNLLYPDGEDIIQNTAGASFATEREARNALARVMFAERVTNEDNDVQT